MPKSPNSQASNTESASLGQSGHETFDFLDEAVKTNIQEGNWMFLQAAVEATGLHEKTLRRRVKRGELKTRRLGKLQNSPVQYWITPDILKGETEKDEHLIGEPDLDDGEFEALEDSSETDESATIRSRSRGVTHFQFGLETGRSPD